MNRLGLKGAGLSSRISVALLGWTTILIKDEFQALTIDV